MVEVFSLQASLHIIRENKLLFTNTQVITQPQSMTRAKPCPEYTAHVTQLHNLKSMPLFRVLQIHQVLFHATLHALPSEWVLVCITQAVDNCFGILTGKNAAWLYQLSHQKDAGVRGQEALQWI